MSTPPKIVPKSVKHVWDLGTALEPETDRIFIIFRSLDHDGAIRLLQPGVNEPTEADLSVDSFSLDEFRAEGLITMLNESMDALRRHRNS